MHQRHYLIDKFSYNTQIYTFFYQMSDLPKAFATCVSLCFTFLDNCNSWRNFEKLCVSPSQSNLIKTYNSTLLDLLNAEYLLHAKAIPVRNQSRHHQSVPRTWNSLQHLTNRHKGRQASRVRGDIRSEVTVIPVGNYGKHRFKELETLSSLGHFKR